MGLKNLFCKLLEKAKQNAPGILAGTGIGLMITGTVLAVKATPEAMRRIEEKKEEEGHDSLTPAQTIQAVWKCYLGALIATVGGASCVVGSLREGNKRQAALMMTANAGENVVQTLRDYREFVADKLGKRKEAEVYNQAMQEVVNRNPPPEDMNREFIDGQAPKPVCYESFGGRYFYVSYETVLKAVNELNHEINTGLDGYVSLNDFYEKIDVPRTELGNLLGWSVETGLIEIPEKDLLSYAGTPNGWPCWILEFRNPPQYQYQFFRKH